MKPAVEIRKNKDGTIDEIVAKDCFLHIEQMSTDGWYLGIDGHDGSYWQFWLGARNYRSAVDVRHTETVPANEMRRRNRSKRKSV